MKSVHFALACIALTLSGCQGWTVQPIPHNAATMLPSQTPFIYTVTAMILPPLSAGTPSITSTSTSPGYTSTLGAEETGTGTPTSPTPPPSMTPSAAMRLQLDIKECNTGLDITHGMGEVTNAYVIMSNLGTIDAQNVCATLNGLDEDRPHPDKSKCVALLPGHYQVALKLTIDTTYQKNTAIQVDMTANGILAQRAGKNSCSNIDLLPPDIGPLGETEPIP